MPAIAQVADDSGPWVVLVGSGYLITPQQNQSNRGGARAGTTFYVLNPETGAVFASYDTGDDPTKESLKAGLHSDATTLGPINTRFVNRVYVGDSEGWLYRLTVTKPNGSSVGLTNPVRLFDASEWNPIYASVAAKETSPGQTYIFVATGLDTLPWTRVKKIQQFALYGLLDTGGNTATKVFEKKLDKADGGSSDERPSAAPTIAGTVVYFTTTTEYPDTPCRIAEATLFPFTFAGAIAHDVTGDGRVDDKDAGGMQMATGRATGPYVADKHLYFGTDNKVQIFGDPNGYNNNVALARSDFRMLSWREVR